MATTELVDLETELKERLIRGLDRVHDPEVLRGLAVLVENLAPETVYALSEEEKREIEEAILDMDAGRGIPHETVCAEVERWFQGKK